MSDQGGEWDRRKAYLARSLFENLQRLSPISEKREPEQSGKNANDRSYSPLPDLIIEKEKNCHDDPEEFYQELEKRMLRLYRKLFLYERNGSSIMSTSSVTSYRGTLEVIDDLNRSQDSDSDGSLADAQDDDDDDGDDSELINESLTQDVLKESEDDNSDWPSHEVITTPALIHAEEASRPTDINNNVAVQIVTESLSHRSPILESSNMFQKNVEGDVQTSDGLVSTQDVTFSGNRSPILLRRTFVLDKNVEKEIRSSERLVARQATTLKYSMSTTYDFELYDFSSIEAMRQKLSETKSVSSMPEARPSPQSSLEPTEFVALLETEKEASPCKETQSLIKEKIVSEAVSSGEDESGKSDGSNFPAIALTDLSRISSPILGTSSRKRIRSADSSSASPTPPRKRKKNKVMCLQTTFNESFSNCTQSCCKQLQFNYFYGIPLIFNLCHCKNHTCQRSNNE